MADAQVRQLSAGFDIGGHTLDHLALTGLNPAEAKRQIDGSMKWLQDVTGRQCVAFCPPLGRFGCEHLPMILEAGFRAVRTVELLSTDLPRAAGELVMMPTSVQAFPHGPFAYTKNGLRRLAFRNLWRCAVDGSSGDWVQLCRVLLDRVLKFGGVLHLWGHSWEIEEAGQWRQLEAALESIRSITHAAMRVSNAQLGELTQTPIGGDRNYGTLKILSAPATQRAAG